MAKIQRFELVEKAGKLRKVCTRQGKIPYSSLHDAKIKGKFIQMKLLNRGEAVVDMYAYQCTHCNKWHLTKQKEGSILVYTAPTYDMQLWISGQDEIGKF